MPPIPKTSPSPMAEEEDPVADPAQDPPTVIGKVPDGVHGDAVPDDPPSPPQPATPPPPQGEESATEHTVVRPRPLVPIAGDGAGTTTPTSRRQDSRPLVAVRSPARS